MEIRKARLGLKALAAAALVMLAVLGPVWVPGGGTALADTTGICSRTQEVQDAILAKLPDVSACARRYRHRTLAALRGI